VRRFLALKSKIKSLIGREKCPKMARVLCKCCLAAGGSHANARRVALALTAHCNGPVRLSATKRAAAYVSAGTKFCLFHSLASVLLGYVQVLVTVVLCCRLPMSQVDSQCSISYNPGCCLPVRSVSRASP